MSQIALRSGRLISASKLKELTRGKEYIAIDQVDKNFVNDRNWFTIGVLCTHSCEKMAKSKTSFMKMTFTSLKKCNTAKSLLINGYKTLSIFVYGPITKDLTDAIPSCVFAIIGPSSMPKKEKYEFALKVTERTQLVMIGRALDFDYCKYVDKYTNLRCEKIINTSTEKYCDDHVNAQINLIKA